LDKKLEAIVKDMRAGKEPNRSDMASRKSPVPSQYLKHSGNNSSKLGSDIDVRSVRSQRSAASRISGGATESKMRVYHEDRSASLNPTEEQWNDIVQQNLKNFEAERQRVIRERTEKLKKIQEEQK
jgi:hypothetical protein